MQPSMQLPRSSPAVQPSGKRASRPSISTATVGDTNVFLVPDVDTGRLFLIDTGAEVSVFPATGADARCRLPPPSLCSAVLCLLARARWQHAVLDGVYTGGGNVYDGAMAVAASPPGTSSEHASPVKPG